MNWFQTVKPVYLVIYTLISMGLLLILSQALASTNLSCLDLAISKTIILHRHSIGIIFYKILTNLLGPIVLSSLSLVIAIIFIKYRKYFLAHLLLLSMTLGNFSFLSIKYVAQRNRPELIMDQISGFSYPSGHATISALFFSFLIGAFCYHYQNVNLRYLLIIGSVLSAVLTGFSRIYLGNHWLSDVIGGYLLGIFILLFTNLNIRVAMYIGKKENNIGGGRVFKVEDKI